MSSVPELRCTWPGHARSRLCVATVPASMNDKTVPRTRLRVASIVMDHMLVTVMRAQSEHRLTGCAKLDPCKIIVETPITLNSYASCAENEVMLRLLPDGH